jgi:hypothetical protein
MATISELRDGLATNLATISGLRTGATIPENVNPPFAIIGFDSSEFDVTMRRGLDMFAFTVTVVVSRADGRNAQNLLDVYCAPTGTTSIKTAIESNRTLGGKANDLRVTGLSNYGNLTIGEVNYLAAEFAVTVYA